MAEQDGGLPQEQWMMATGMPLQSIPSESDGRNPRALGFLVGALVFGGIVAFVAFKLTGGAMSQIADPDSPAIAKIHAEAAGRSLGYHAPKVATHVASHSRSGSVHRVPQVIYTVHTGGSLKDISRIFGMPLELLKTLNPGVPEDRFLGSGSRVTVHLDGVTVPEPEDKKPLLHPMVGVPMLDGKGRRVRRRSVSWGTALMVKSLDKALNVYGDAYPEGPVVIVSDMSRRGGGRLKPHHTHREGRDVDLSYVPVPKHDNGGFLKMKPGVFDVERNWTFIKAMVDTGQLRLILMDWKIQKMLYKHAKEVEGMDKFELERLFQYPRDREEEVGLIRHWDNHNDHMHVRFACPPSMPNCE